MVESAISRSDTTGFLSLSRSIVSCEPDEIIRARCAASRTRSNRLSTLSMQSSTVTRAIDCRSVKWDQYADYAGVVIGAEAVSQGKSSELARLLDLRQSPAQPWNAGPVVPRPRSSTRRTIPTGQERRPRPRKKSLYARSNYWCFGRRHTTLQLWSPVAITNL